MPPKTGEPDEESRPFDLDEVDVLPAHKAVVDHLRRAIHVGQVPPGAKLPPERQLSIQLGVSRVTLREALHVLRDEGYVTIKLGHAGGVFVRDDSQSFDEISPGWDERASDLGAVFDLRALVEGFAAQHAASNISNEDLEVLDASNRALADVANTADFRREDLRFHTVIAQASGRPIVRDVVDQLRAGLFLPFLLFDLEAMKAHSVEDHVLIADALRARDPKLARARMSRHVQRSAKAIERILAQRS